MKSIGRFILDMLTRLVESSYDQCGPEQFDSHAEYMESLAKLDEKDFEAGMETLSEYESAHRAELESMM